MFKLRHKKLKFITDIFAPSGGGGGRAAGVEQQFNQQAINELRRQFDVTQGQISPFVEAGQRQLPALEAGATPGGLDATLAQLFDTDIFGSLVEERQRGVQGQLAAGGLTRSGTAIEEAARVPTDIGLALESLLTGRQQALATGGQSGAINLGQIGAGASGGIANLLTASGQAGSAGILTDAQARAQGGQNLLNTAATIGSIIRFSDPNLKENTEQVGQIGPLPLVQWDWIPSVRTIKLISSGFNLGFLTTDVKKHFPHHVYTYCGFDCIDYPNLLNDLESV